MYTTSLKRNIIGNTTQVVKPIALSLIMNNSQQSCIAISIAFARWRCLLSYKHTSNTAICAAHEQYPRWSSSSKIANNLVGSYLGQPRLAWKLRWIISSRTLGISSRVHVPQIWRKDDRVFEVNPKYPSKSNFWPSLSEVMYSILLHLQQCAPVECRPAH